MDATKGIFARSLAFLGSLFLRLVAMVFGKAQPQYGRMLEIEIRDKNGHVKKACPTLIDTGADVNLISKETVDWCELGADIQPLGSKDPVAFGGIGGEHTEPRGKITLLLSIKDGSKFIHGETFYIVEDAPFEIAVGYPFARKSGLVKFAYKVLVAKLKEPNRQTKERDEPNYRRKYGSVKQSENEKKRKAKQEREALRARNSESSSSKKPESGPKT